MLSSHKSNAIERFSWDFGTSWKRRMLRIVSSALRGISRTAVCPARSTKCNISSILIKPDSAVAGFSFQAQSRLSSSIINGNNACNRYSTLFSKPALSNILCPESQVAGVPVRTLTKFSIRKGKRKTVKAVIKRFYRLDWGIWIRTKAGRNKRLWKKTIARKRRLRRHVMTTAKQSWLLDTMVTKCWRRPKYYVDDPYNPYHKRESFFITRTKPQPA